MTYTPPFPDNTDDVIDSRDVIYHIGSLTEERDDAEAEGEEFDEQDAAALAMLEELAEEAAQYAPDWEYGETLIRESYFTEYMKDLARDCGMVSGEESWPLNHIDWEEAADEAKIDYTEVDFDGITYFIR